MDQLVSFPTLNLGVYTEPATDTNNNDASDNFQWLFDPGLAAGPISTGLDPDPDQTTPQNRSTALPTVGDNTEDSNDTPVVHSALPYATDFGTLIERIRFTTNPNTSDIFLARPPPPDQQINTTVPMDIGKQGYALRLNIVF